MNAKEVAWSGQSCSTIPFSADTLSSSSRLHICILSHMSADEEHFVLAEAKC